jgi:Protein of unknown function C-terminus (DUF2399)
VSKIAEDLAKAVRDVTKGWKTEKRHADRFDRVSYHSLAKLRGGFDRITIKEVAFEVMEEAYNHASGGGQYYANARQIMYAARRLMLAKEPSLSNQIDSGFSAYFTQTLLKDYLEYEGGTGWKVVWDARGHLIEPYTGKSIGLGGVNVMEYINGWTSDFEEYPEPDIIEERIETKGPTNRFGAVLFIEKEGFTEILKDAGIDKKHDVALMSTKGLPVKAACDLARRLEGKGVKIYVLHDFDLAGFKIVKTLREGTRMAYGTKVVELGLRGDDVAGLDSEPVEYSQGKDPREYLARCGASGEEQNFLVEGRHGKTWFGRRVEINAMTSDQLVAWLEKKLKEHGVKKVIPEKETLVPAYHRARYLQKLQAQIEEWKDEEGAHDGAPKDLRKRVEKILAKTPAISWDDAIWTCAGEDPLDKEEP